LHVSDQLAELGKQRGLVEADCWAYYFRGCALYQLNDLAGAEVAFAAVVARRYLAHGLAFSQAAFGLACVHLALGRLDLARELVDSVSAYAAETAHRRIAVDVDAFRAYMVAGAGQLDPGWAETAPLDVDGQPAPLNTFVDPRLMRVRALLRVKTPASLARAAAILDQVHQLALTYHNARCQIETLALRALLDEARGGQDAALTALGEAVDLAAPGGVIRTFVDLGAGMAHLLGHLAARDGAGVYLDQVLAAFDDMGPAQPVAPTPRSRRSAAPPELVEPLSDRELDVLELLAQRYSNDEIASALSIAPSTVKRHAVNIYQKLQVQGRRQAVARARELGLLPGREDGSH
jgi:LuxR family maltose regulon positive regulatory protein